MKLGLSIAAGALLLAPTVQAQAVHGPPQLKNTGEWAVPVFTGHDLTPPGAEGGPRILYAPSEADDSGYRAAIAAAAGGGAVVDYFDASAGTPDVTLMSTYDCVYTWANFAYANNVAFGDNLAAVNDAGVDVVLGVFCTYTSGNFLSGQIMTSAYCPVVSPAGNNHFSNNNYSGDGGTCLYTGVTTSLACTFRDFLVTQGNGVVDGTYNDGEICGAIRPNPGGGAGDVIYNNGAGAFQLGCAGEWADFAANSCTCDAGSGAFGACNFFNGGGTNPTGYTCTNVPIAGQTWTTEVEGAGATFTIVVVSDGGSASGSFIPIPTFGEILVGGTTFAQDVVAGGTTHNIPVPPGLSGVTGVATQGVVVRGTVVVMRNAQIVNIGG